MNRFGFVRISTASIRTTVADPEANASEILRVLDQVADSDIVLFPELCITGYTCADLFGQTTLLSAAERAIARILAAESGRARLVVLGAPLAVGGELYNCAVAIAAGRVVGIVPKQFLPTYKEFYERRWFRPASEIGPGRSAECEALGTVSFLGEETPFGTDLLFEAGEAVIGIEICEDLWVPIPPSSFQALAGASILLNPSASNETIGKSQYRRELVVGQSGRCIAAYAYAGAGPTESTTDLVFGGHCLIAENGHILGESPRVGDGGPIRRDSYWITRDVDVEKLLADRRATTTFETTPDLRRSNRRIELPRPSAQMEGLQRVVPGTPFVPAASPERHRRCAEIFGIQCAGLAKRIEQLSPNATLNIGVSGGLDSTLALLVAVKTCDMLGLDRSRVHGLTMPGFGTTQRTRTNAVDLMDQLGVTPEVIDISALSLDAFRALGHAPFGIDCLAMSLEEFREALASVPVEKRHDLVFENVQARLRTFLLMSRGFVVGTGDLSEMALGWSTYNGDHMSMYNPNSSIPKTLVSFLVRYAAENEFPDGPTRTTLLSIAETVISPELLPTSASGEIVQSTEATLGPYELLDFILFNAVRCGFSPEKIRFLSEYASFTRTFSPDEIDRAFHTFYKRFFSQQFKRSCVPDGPKVGTVSLSPRGDWRMPSDASPTAWLGEANRTD
jgi:NAD+ synthase (glutamine-hydrolysing)